MRLHNHHFVETFHVRTVDESLLSEVAYAFLVGYLILAEEAHEPDERVASVVFVGVCSVGEDVLANLGIVGFAKVNVLRLEDVALGAVGQEGECADVLAVEHEGSVARRMRPRLFHGAVDEIRIGIDDARYRLDELLSDRRQLELVGVSDEQVAPELLLEFAHGATHALRRYEIEFGSLCYGFRLGDIKEIMQIFDVHLAPPPSR